MTDKERKIHYACSYMSASAIAKKYGIEREEVFVVMKKVDEEIRAGWKRPKKKRKPRTRRSWGAEEVRILIELRNAGKGTQEIADRLKRKYHSVTTKLRWFEAQGLLQNAKK